jgi:hypothetical protein
MAYKQACTGRTREEALEKAEAFIKTLDMTQQGSIYGTYQTAQGEWVVTVHYYGFD